MTSEDDRTATSGSVLCALVKDLVQMEDNRRTSLDSRATASITASGVLVSLILALIAATNADNNPNLPSSTNQLLTAAVALLVLSGVVAISVFAPRSFYPYDVEMLAAELVGTWTASEDDAQLRELSERLEQLRQLQNGNNAKGALLLIAVVMQVVAIGILGVTAIVAMHV